MISPRLISAFFLKHEMRSRVKREVRGEENYVFQRVQTW
jgi:hypothetical protein